MTSLIPSSSCCHPLQLPPPEKDDRLNLNVRTGSSSVLLSSLVFVHGGLTVGLDLDVNISPGTISSALLQRLDATRSKKLRNYLSGELFYLDLLSKVWTRVKIPEGAPKPKPRLFHEMSRGSNCIYIFGGLTFPDDLDELTDENACRLVPCNDFWEFNLSSRSWTLLHDGSQNNHSAPAPSPRYCHKMTIILNLHFAKKKDHFGLMIAGGQNANAEPLFDNYIFDLVDKEFLDISDPISLLVTSGNVQKDADSGLSKFTSSNSHHELNVNYLNSAIVNFSEEVEYHHHNHHNHNQQGSETHGPVVQNITTVEEESLVVYSPTQEMSEDEITNPLLSFRVGKKLGTGKTMPLYKRKRRDSHLDPKIHREPLLRTIPYNLRYPTGGLFGQNLVIVGFLPGDFDISIFIYNRPTGKWSRLNVFCHHDYGSHRYWGGFAWTSHHKVVLLGNYVTSKTTSSVRFFTSMITVSLPVTNILASFEMTGSHFHGPDGKKYVMNETSSAEETASASSAVEDESASSISDSDVEDQSPRQSPRQSRKFSSVSSKSNPRSGVNNITFHEYVHYAAPKVNFTKIRSVFPPAAITLGRSALDRYGDLMSDLEFVSANGDRIPVSMTVLQERWGRYFIEILSKAYVSAVDKFENDLLKEGVPISDPQDSDMARLKSNKDSTGSGDSNVQEQGSSGRLNMSSHSPHKEAPQFRLPFQDLPSTSSVNTRDPITSVDPHKISNDRKASFSSSSSTGSFTNTQLQDIPPQMPIPEEPLPPVPLTTSFRSSSRKNSADHSSPRASLIHTLTVLRNIPSQNSRSPRASPFTSPRSSVSGEAEPNSRFTPPAMPEKLNLEIASAEPVDHSSERRPSTRRSLSSTSVNSYKKSSLGTLISATSTPTNDSESSRDNTTGPSGSMDNTFLNFENADPKTFRMEPSLIPRKLYIPFCTSSLKAFAEYLYTGQVGNRWPLRPCALDCMLISRYFKVPLLYDLTSEVFYGIIGRKEVHIIKEGHKLRKQYISLLEALGNPPGDDFKFPLDEYEGLMNTVDDGYLDVALLRKSSSVHRGSTSSQGSRVKHSSLSMQIPEEPTQFNKGDYFQSPIKKPITEEASSPKSGLYTQLEHDENFIHNRYNFQEEGGINLHYLDFQEKNSMLGPRSKSVFDRPAFDVHPSFKEETADEKERILSTTLENLVSPDSPPPHNCVIEIMYEISTMCTDVKLMLRALNVMHMWHALEDVKQDIAKLEGILQMRRNSDAYNENTLEHTMTESNDRTARPSLASLETRGSSGPTRPPNTMKKSQTLEAGDGQGSSTKPVLQPMRSSTSMNTILSKLRFTPLRSQNPATRTNSKSLLEDPKEIDKKIQQIIRQDEKKKSKAAKEDKAKLGKEQSHKGTSELLKMKQGAQGASAEGTEDDGMDSASMFSFRSLGSKKGRGYRAGFMHKLGKAIRHPESRKSKEQSDDQQSLSSQKSSPSVSSGTSKKSHKTLGIFGRHKK